MKAPLHRISARLFNEPWLVRGDVHQNLRQQFRAAVARRDSDALSTAWFQKDNDPFSDPVKVTPQNCLSFCDISQGLAVVTVQGILAKHLSSMETICGGFDVKVLEYQAQALMQRPDIHTVIIHYISPGGAASGIADCAQVLKDLAATKRLISYIDEGCSGAYWLACAAPEIYGGKSCVVGSISAMCSFEDVSEMYRELGIKVEVFRDGDLKGAGIEGTSLSETQKADIQSRIEHIGGMFKAFVSAQRPGVPADAMRGQWFYGDTGLEIGLLDAIAPTLQHVIAMAAV